MSSLRFPTIETKKSLMQEEDYNFVNKDKKKKLSSGNPLELIEELKRKIQEQKKEIQNRNMTIQGLQRNFESLSVIVKNEKAQSAVLRAELQHLKQNSESGDKRASEYHQKCIMLQKQVKSLKEELKTTKKAHSQCSQIVAMTEQFKKQIVQLEEVNEKLHNKLMQSDVDKKVLETELNKFKLLEKDKRLMNERIVDLQDQLKNLTDINNGLNYRQVAAEEEQGRLKNEIASREKKIQELKMRLNSAQKQKERIEFDSEFLKKEVTRLTTQIEQSEAMISNKDLYSKIKMEEEQRLRQQHQNLLQEYRQLQESFKKVTEESEQKSGMLTFAHNQIDLLRKDQRQMKASFASKEANYQNELQKLMISIRELHQQLNLSTGESSELTKKLLEQQQRNTTYNDKISNLHENIDEMNQKMQEYQERYGHYLRLIAKNEPDVVITNQRSLDSMQNGASSSISKLQGDIRVLEKTISQLQSSSLVQNNNIQNMRKYIKTLEEQVSTKSQELLQKTKLLRKFQEEEQELNKMIANQRNLTQKQKLEAEALILDRMRQLETQKLKTQKEKEQERRRLEQQLQEQRQRSQEKLRRQREQSQKYSKLLQNYKQQQKSLKQMMSKQQNQITRLQQQKEEQIKRIIKEKEDQLQKQKKNNNMLWSDNKKLKDLQNKLKQESKTMLDQKQTAKREEIQRLKRQLERKYKDQMSSIKSQESNSHQLKKILTERNNQYKELTESHNKLKGESQFYKNRNKELESLVSRMEKQFKQKTADLQRENKSSKQVIEVLQKKLKEAETNVSQSQKKQKRELKYLYDEIEQMKKTAKNQRVEEKISLVNKSMGDLDTSLKTLMNTMSCNYCVEVVKDCVRLDCGHIYCKKCKGGYEPNCGQCKKKGTPIPDKMIDDSVSKAQYMRILINTIKDDLSKISQ